MSISLVISCIVYHCFHNGKLTYNVGYLFHLLLICVSEMKYCDKTGLYSIEYWLFILHWWITICGSNNHEKWKTKHRMLAIYPFWFSGTNKFKYSIGAKIIVGNILSNLFYRVLLFYQWKYNIKCWLFLSSLTQLYHWIDLFWKDRMV